MDVNLMNGSIQGQPVGAFPKKPKAFALQRVCESEECMTVLSMYNPGPRCAIHWT
jgi:hypothetical protein